MSWTLLAIAGVGGVLGLRYKVPAVLAASLVVLIVTGAIGYAVGYSPSRLAVAIALHLAALQVAYLCGLSCVHLWRSHISTEPARPLVTTSRAG